MREFLKEVFEYFRSLPSRWLEARRYLHGPFEHYFYHAAKAYAQSEKHFGDLVCHLDSVIAAYFAMVGPVEPPHLKSLRLNIQGIKGKRWDVTIVVTRLPNPGSGKRVTFGMPRIELTEDDIRQEVAR